MNRSRTREFQDFRSNAASNRSQVGSLKNSTISQTTVSQACVNCVNKIIANRQKKVQRESKQKDRAEFRKNYQLLNSWVDPQSLYRQSLKKDALIHNSRMIQDQKIQKQIQKQEDLKYAEKTLITIEQAQKSMKAQIQAQKKRQEEYYQEIHDQYVVELKRKDNQKYPKYYQSQRNQGLPLFNADTTEQKLQYKRQLERQMQQKKRKQQQQKIYNQKREKQLIQEYNKQADKYHADSYQAMKMSKQEVFDGLKNLEISKKRKIEQERKANEQQRLQTIKQENQERSKMIKIKMKEMQRYVEGLKNQLFQKEQKLRSSKLADTGFLQKMPKSTEQIQAELEVKKECRSCHKNYPQQFIGPVPKK